MTQIGSVYGEALYQLALSEGVQKQILSEMKVLQDSFRAEPDFLRLLCSPNLSKEERCTILDDSFRGKIHPYLLNFLKILTEKSYVRHFSECCDRYVELYNKDNNILMVTAVTAVAMTTKQTAALTQKLSTITGKEIMLRNRVDSACLGGVRLDYDGQRLDGTVAHRLDKIRDLLKNTVL